FAQTTGVDDFDVRNGLDNASMVSLFSWSETQFLRLLEGSPIRRIGHERWLRNLAVGLGNAAVSLRGDAHIIAALQARLAHPSDMVRDHVQWALAQHGVVCNTPA
ncbi:MAG: tRNA epoxyqueuosine(34) reductase QueG, partial [Burkholderiales bacterium]|nr:tRNA epoxyqueuosine(34) reductase QueG [Burkholderiales bacterium]